MATTIWYPDLRWQGKIPSQPELQETFSTPDLTSDRLTVPWYGQAHTGHHSRLRTPSLTGSTGRGWAHWIPKIGCNLLILATHGDHGQV
ncbi:hypothetical protein VTN00DRAFT_5274 [Thermoascus crustaceus]|uniref:uncharacterized protein n=1 Tax=Thermoascus crustaceus TaxID=5088 RepID=UPI003742D850